MMIGRCGAKRKGAVAREKQPCPAVAFHDFTIVLM
jgi:hypothetical protein